MGRTCGNDVIGPGEMCDGTDLRGVTCAGLGFTGGTLACLSDCSGFDTSSCTVICGNDVVERDEQCDGIDLQGLDCTDFPGFTGGTLACTMECTFDTSGCIDPKAICGNDVIERGELCDGTDLAGHCIDFGFIGGTLACNATCDNLNFTACTGGPPGWTCPVVYYGNSTGCHCGCGVLDPDCSDDSVASCKYCGGYGACFEVQPYNSEDCPGQIDPAHNWLCRE
jgi:hypothetical protein